MSVVYLARDEVLERDVAIKVLHPHLARDPEARNRFAREARAVAQLRHPNIPEIYESGAGGVDDMRAFIVNEFVDGAPLSRLLREGRVTLPETGILLAMGVARALAKASEHNVVHRDVKPENVLVGKDGVVKLTDFGIAQVLGLESMTMTGTLIGSPAHMAPEQIDGTRDLDHRVDVWGLGTVLYMCVTGGKLPFEADNAHSLLRKIADGEVIDPRRLSPHVEASLAQIIMRCLQRDRTLRYQDAGTVAAELQAWLTARGLAKVEAEVRDFMADSAGYERILGKRLEVTLMAMAEEALQSREKHRALELYGRVLALDPDHADASEALRRLERRLRTTRGFGRAAIALAGVGAIAGVAVLAWPSPTDPSLIARARGAALGSVLPVPVPPELVVPTPPTPEAPAGARFGDALSFELARVDGLLTPDKAHGTNDPTDPGRPDPNGTNGTNGTGDHGHVKPPQAPIPVQLTAEPPAIRVTLDGKTVSCPAQVNLLPGTYTAVLRHPKCPNCKDETQDVVVPKHATGPIAVHFVFHQKAGPSDATDPSAPAIEPAQFELRCTGGGFAVDSHGKRFACGGVYPVPLKSAKPEVFLVTVFAADQSVIDRRTYTIRPKERIVWTP